MRARRIELASGSREQTRALARTIRAFSERPADVSEVVSGVLAAVRDKGDDAVLELSRRWDTPNAPSEPRIGANRLRGALDALDGGVRGAIETAIENVTAVCRAELADDASVTLSQGHQVELRQLAVRRAGVYVPGGRAPYPSTVVMCSVPARVAGVEQTIVVTPPGPEGEPDPVILAACELCEVDEVWAIGGAQAIAALAFGTQTIEPVDVIVGPGNDYVQEAKRQVTGTVGIDGVEGPSELVVIADGDADPELAALDLAAQGEHGRETMLALLSPSSGVLDTVESALSEVASRHGGTGDASAALVRVPDLEAAVTLANELAPEHLELMCSNAEALAAGVRSSGCVFLGRNGGAAFGDYAAGSNHVLPTGGAGRFAGPLGVSTFRRRQALVSLPDEAARALAPHVSRLARAEGFPLHAASAEERLATG
jgi:histidinol dehydrogenase